MKVEFSAFPRAFTGNVAVFVAADKQLLATAQTMDKASGGAIARALERRTLHRRQGPDARRCWASPAPSARLLLLGVGEGRKLDARGAEGLGGVIAAEANAARATRPSPWWSIRCAAAG